MITTAFNDKTGILTIQIPTTGSRRPSSTGKTLIVCTESTKLNVGGEEMRLGLNLTVPNVPANQ
jgi:hypothetical protein